MHFTLVPSSALIFVCAWFEADFCRRGVRFICKEAYCSSSDAISVVGALLRAVPVFQVGHANGWVICGPSAFRVDCAGSPRDPYWGCSQRGADGRGADESVAKYLTRIRFWSFAGPSILAGREAIGVVIDVCVEALCEEGPTSSLFTIFPCAHPSGKALCRSKTCTIETGVLCFTRSACLNRVVNLDDFVTTQGGKREQNSEYG